MAGPNVEQFVIDYGELLEQNPDSSALSVITDPLYDPWDRKRKDWGQALQEDLSKGDTISPVAAAAVYLGKQAPGFEYNELALDIAGRLIAGQAVVGYDPARTLKSIAGFKDEKSGVLDADMSVVPTNPPYVYRKALQFRDRNAPVILPIEYVDLAVGNDEVAELYDEQLGNKGHLRSEKDSLARGYVDPFSRRLQNACVMQKLGLIEGCVQFEDERASLLEMAVDLTDLRRIFPKPNKTDFNPSPRMEFIRVLPSMYTLDSQVAEERINYLASSRHIDNDNFRQELAEALAQVRSFVPLSDLSEYARKAALLSAEAEIYTIRIDGPGHAY